MHGKILKPCGLNKYPARHFNIRWSLETAKLDGNLVSLLPGWRRDFRPIKNMMMSSKGNSSYACCAENSPVIVEFSAQRPVARSFDVFCDLRQNERLSKQSRGWWFGTPLRSLWCHCNDINKYNSHVFETLRDLMVRHLMWYWNGSQKIDPSKKISEKDSRRVFILAPGFSIIPNHSFTRKYQYIIQEPTGTIC